MCEITVSGKTTPNTPENDILQQSGKFLQCVKQGFRDISEEGVSIIPLLISNRSEFCPTGDTWEFKVTLLCSLLTAEALTIFLSSLINNDVFCETFLAIKIDTAFGHPE